MTKQELIEIVKKTVVDISSSMPDWADTIGVRYDNIEVVAGQELEPSISNIDRDDPRDFPAYDPDADHMDGTSCYYAGVKWDDEDDVDDNDYFYNFLNGKKEAAWKHCSIVIGKQTDDYCEDEGEVVLWGCEVVKVLW